MTKARTKIVLIHGLGAGAWTMFPLRHRLARMGFDAVTWSYPSLRLPIRKQSENLRRFFEQLDAEGQPYHVVAHSMGSIVTRAAIAKSVSAKLRRIVLLAPPNAGLAAARCAPWFIKQFCQPMNDLADVPESFVNRLPQVLPVEVGVIAAQSDVLIPIKNTHVLGQSDHATVRGSHNSLLLSHTVAEMVRKFLIAGSFAAERCQAA